MTHPSARRGRRRWLTMSCCATALAVVALMCGCSSSSTPGAAGTAVAATVRPARSGSAENSPGSESSSVPSIAGQTITLYNGQHEQTTQALVDAFEKRTGAKVKIRSDDEDVLAQQIQQEGSKSPADVIFTENSPPLVRLDESHLLSPVTASTLARVPAQYNAGDHDWIGVSARVSEIVYNTDDLKPADLPKSVLDLADPQWKGKLSIAPSETDFAPIVTSVAADKGDAAALAWLKGLKRNAGQHVDPDNETLVEDVNSGVTEIGVINHYYWYRLSAEDGAAGTHSALQYFSPRDDGYLLDVSGAAVIKSSKHQEAAQQLVAYLVSQSGQQVLAAGDSYEYPLASGAAPSPRLSPFSSIQAKSFDLDQIGDGTKAIRLLQQAGLL